MIRFENDPTLKSRLSREVYHIVENIIRSNIRVMNVDLLLP